MTECVKYDEEKPKLPAFMGEKQREEREPLAPPTANVATREENQLKKKGYVLHEARRQTGRFLTSCEQLRPAKAEVT